MVLVSKAMVHVYYVTTRMCVLEHVRRYAGTSMHVGMYARLHAYEYTCTCIRRTGYRYTKHHAGTGIANAQNSKILSIGYFL